MDISIEKMKMSKELELLVLLTSANMTEWQTEKALALSNEVDRILFTQLAEQHRVYAIVAHNMNKLHLFDDGAFSRIRKKAAKHSFEAMKRSATLVKICQAFANAGIRMILLKGPVLGLKFYNDPGLRISNDLDLLISKEDFWKAQDILNTAGFFIEGNYSKTQIEYMIKSEDHHLEFLNENKESVELHWRIDKYINLSFDEVWKKHRTLPFFGAEVCVPDTSLEAVFLMHHGMRHGYYRLKWMLDIAELLRDKSVNWNDIIELSDGLGVKENVFCSISLCFLMEPFDLHEFESRELNISDHQTSILFRRTPDACRPMEFTKMMIPFLSDVITQTGEPTKSKQYRGYRRKYYIEKYNGEKSIARALYYLKRFSPEKADFGLISLPKPLYFLYYIERPFYKVYRIIIRK